MARDIGYRQECCDGTVALPPFPQANLLLRNPVDKEKDASDYRVFAGIAEISAAWRKTSDTSRDYLSVKLMIRRLRARGTAW